VTVLVLLLGGSGTRFGGGLPKQFLEMELFGMEDGRRRILEPAFGQYTKLPLFEVTARAFLWSMDIKMVVATVPERYIQEAIFMTSLERLRNDFPNISFHPVAGGNTRHNSFQNSARFICNFQYSLDKAAVLVHDANRPYLDAEFFTQIRETVSKIHRNNPPDIVYIPGIPVVNSMVSARDGKVTGYPERDSLMDVQTPQIIPGHILCGKRTASKKEYTDEGSYFLELGYSVEVFPGSRENIKITFPQDAPDHLRRYST